MGALRSSALNATPISALGGIVLAFATTVVLVATPADSAANIAVGGALIGCVPAIRQAATIHINAVAPTTQLKRQIFIPPTAFPRCGLRFNSYAAETMRPQCGTAGSG